MGIINQNLDASQKRRDQTFAFGAIATGVTNLLSVIPYDAYLQGVNLAAFGISGAPVYSLSVFRATSGGLTSVGLGVSLAAVAMGTTGPVGATITGIGATLLRGDVLCLTSGGANSAVATAALSISVAGSADINKYPATTVG